jgi:hypothetical protein
MQLYGMLECRLSVGEWVEMNKSVGNRETVQGGRSQEGVNERADAGTTDRRPTTIIRIRSQAVDSVATSSSRMTLFELPLFRLV